MAPGWDPPLDFSFPGLCRRYPPGLRVLQPRAPWNGLLEGCWLFSGSRLSSHGTLLMGHVQRKIHTYTYIYNHTYIHEALAQLYAAERVLWAP